MSEATYREAYSYDPETHERIPNKRDLLKELKAAIIEEAETGRVTSRYNEAMEAIRNV